MANYIANSDLTLEQCITNGSMVDGENLTIRSGAVITCTVTPSILMGSITIDDGEFIIDGQNITSGNTINFIGEGGDAAYDETLNVNGGGVFRVNGDWFDIGTTDGTNSQVIDLSSATGVDLWDGDNHISYLPMCQVETGRRITFDNPSADATDTLEVGDWVRKSTDHDVMGKIKTITDTYMIVWYLSGTLADDDEIIVRKIVDNMGPDLQEVWSADVNDASGDIKEAGVYQEFGNSRYAGNAKISYFHHGIGGFVFDHAFGSTDLTFGTAVGTTGGFVPPSGCNIRVPNVIMSSSGTVSYAAGNCESNTDPNNLYTINAGNAGEVYLSILNCPGVYIYLTNAAGFTAEYVGSFRIYASNCASVVTIDHCVTVCDAAVALPPAFSGFNDCLSGGTMTFCLAVQSAVSQQMLGAATSVDVEISDCIVTAGSDTNNGTSGQGLYYFYFVTNVVMNNCVGFQQDHIQNDRWFYFGNCINFELNWFMFGSPDDLAHTISSRYVFYLSGSSIGKIVGLEQIGAALPDSYFGYCIDSNNIKIRCMGMITDKVDFSTYSSYFIIITGFCYNIDLARLWKDNGFNEEFFSSTASTKGITIKNCSGKYAAEIEPLFADSSRLMGIHGGSGTPGDSTAGWEDALPSSYGNSFHDNFRSDTVGNIVLTMVAPGVSADETTVVAGSPRWFKDNDLDMVNGDIVTFEMGYFAKGHTGFPGTYSAVIQTSAWGANEWPNITLDFQWMLDGGSWNGSWLDVRTASNWTAISGDIEGGIKLKIRLTATGDSLDMTFLLIDTTTTLADQYANMYPIDQDEVTLSVTAQETDGTKIENARVRVMKVSDDSIILEGLTNASGVVAITDYIYTADEAVYGWVRKATGSPLYIQASLAGTISSTGYSAAAVMISDE